jgi:hypothetical protein
MDKFTDKYINNWNILTKAIVGFEFEFYTERSYYKLLELLNRELYPIKVHGARKYHSSIKVDENNFKIEPDLSGGYDMVEMITGPLHYNDSKIILLKILKILKKHANTNNKSSLHINISFDDKYKNINNLNPLKIILNIDEDKIYNLFPNRKDNFYAMSVKNMIPFKDFDFIGSAAHIIENNIELPDTKYRGININKIREGRIEFRYIGGVGYHLEVSKILELLDYFILISWSSIDKSITKEDRKLLLNYLNKNINNFKKFKKVENFIAEFPSIQLEIDKNDEIVIVKTYYSEIYDEIYELISNIYNLNNCIINYDTSDRKIEIIDADFKAILDIENVKFINCIINSGRFKNCDFVSSEIKNVHLHNCDIKDSDIFNSKIENCIIDQTSIIKESYFYGGLLNGFMESGVFRAGKIGDYGEIDKNVKIITDSENYFGIIPTKDNKGNISDITKDKKKF